MSVATDLLVSAQEFFQEKVGEAQRELKIGIDGDVEFYVVNLLVAFINPREYTKQLGCQIDLLETPLAFILQEAVSSEKEDQINLYRALGDTSLYISGFFQDYFNRKTFDIDYYINMGRTAYGHVAKLDQSRTETYESLSLRFHDLVEIVATVSDAHIADKPVDLLAVYDRWTKTNSERLRKMLEKSGIHPIPSNTKTSQ